ncbi:hypothetical protein WHI96_07830 [Pseudonocardia tropica]|uniref:Uncharacterized protein n=2 Tax=Pseudonocardia tropica TaxID=681289 RepID=A0ABV1JSS1_9PSEU
MNDVRRGYQQKADAHAREAEELLASLNSKQAAAAHASLAVFYQLKANDNGGELEYAIKDLARQLAGRS